MNDLQVAREQLLIRERVYRFSVKDMTLTDQPPLIQIPISERAARQILADMRESCPTGDWQLMELNEWQEWQAVE
jgi:hypothetical protein